MLIMMRTNFATFCYSDIGLQGKNMKLHQVLSHSPAPTSDTGILSSLTASLTSFLLLQQPHGPASVGSRVKGKMEHRALADGCS